MSALDIINNAEQPAATEPQTVATADWDVVVLRNGQRLLGTIEDLPGPDDVGLVLTTPGGGRIGLKADMVARVRPSLENRLQRFEELSREELLDLARHCLINDRKEEARRALAAADTAKALPLPELRLLARLTDELSGGQQALPLYQRCLKLGDTSSSTKGRMDELKEAERAWLQAKAAILAQANKLSPIRDGLEVNPNWRGEDPKYANPVTVSSVQQDNGPRVNRMLRADFEGGKEHKAAISLTKVFRIGDKQRLVFWVHNADMDNLALSVAVKTGNTYEYFESKPYRVPASGSWQQVAFDLQAEDFKSAASDWKHSDSIDNLQDIREVQLQIHNKNISGSILIDSIAFHGLEAVDLQEL